MVQNVDVIHFLSSGFLALMHLLSIFIILLKGFKILTFFYDNYLNYSSDCV